MDLPTYNSQNGCGIYYMIIGYELLKKWQKTLNINRAFHSLPVRLFALHMRVFKALAPTGQNISKSSDSSHFEQAADIKINAMTGIPTLCPNQVPQ
jgi:hypothetical protein